MSFIRALQTFVAVSALVLITAAAARPIFCDRFETDTCTQLPQIFVEMADLDTLDSGQLLIRLEKAALDEDLEVFLTSSDPGILNVPPVVRIAAAEEERIVPVSSGVRDGEVMIEVTAVGYEAASRQVRVNPRGLQILAGSRIEVGHSIEGFVELDRPAPAGGTEIAINSSNPGVLSISPSAVTIPEERTRLRVTLSATATGSVDITVTAPGYEESTLAATAIGSIISVGLAPDLVPGQQRSLPLSLLEPAPAGGLEVHFASSDPAVVDVDETLFIPEGAWYPTRNPQLQALTRGEALITVSAEGFAPIQRAVPVRDYSLDFTFSRSELSPGWADLVKVELSAPAPPGGLQVFLTSSNSAVFAAPASFAVPAGQSQAEFELLGVAEGNAVLTAGGESIEETAVDIEVGKPPGIYFGHVLVGKDLQLERRAKLSRSPPKPVDLTLTVDDPSIALVSLSALDAGSSTVTFSSESDRSVFVQGLGTGATFITVSAEGYRDRWAKLTVTESGFYFSSSGIVRSDPSPAFDVSLRVARLRDGGFIEEQQVLRGGLEIEIPVFNADASVGVVTDNPAVFAGGQSDDASVRFNPQAYGATTLSFTQPQGFTTPTNRDTSVDVTIGRQLLTRDVTIGRGLVAKHAPVFSGSLRPRNLYLEIADPTIASISEDRHSPGEDSLELLYSNLSFQDYSYYLQGLEVGTTELVVSSPGLETITSTITVTESGLYFDTHSNPLAITLSSEPFDLAIAGAFVGQDGELHSGFDLRPDLEPVVSLIADQSLIGEFLENPIARGEDGDIVARFQPLALGGTTIDLEQPPGFSVQTGHPTELDIEVVPAELLLMGSWIVGKDLQTVYRVQLRPEATGTTDILVRVEDPAKALLSRERSQAGVSSILIEGVSRDSASFFYVEGLELGDTEIVATASGTNEVRRSLEVAESAFVFDRPARINTIVDGFRVPIHLGATPLSDKLWGYAFQGIRPGLSLEVPVVINDSKLGPIYGSPVVFEGSFASTRTVEFDPEGLGESTITLTQPAGFSTPPAEAATIEVKVRFPRIDLRDAFVGDRLQTRQQVGLDQTPSEPIDLVLRVDDPSRALLSTERDGPGSQTITIESVDSGFSEFFYVQGFERGETTIVASAPGYDDQIATVSVGTSAFRMSGWNPLVTTPNSEPAEYSVSSWMSAGGRTGPQELRAGLTVEVPIMTSNPLVGVLTPDQLVLEGGTDNDGSFQFDPERVGTTTLSLIQPAGFVQTQESSEVVVNRSCFWQDSFSETRVGKDLQASRTIALDNTPETPVDIELTVADPSVARVGSSPDLPGSASATIPLVNDTNSRSFYIEGISKGSTTIQITAEGCDPIAGQVTVIDAGAFIDRPNWIATGFLSSPTGVEIRLGAVSSDGQVWNAQGLRPGLTLDVPVAVADPNVGSMSEAFVRFHGGQPFAEIIAFVPEAIGQTSISLTQPDGLVAPVNRSTTIPVNVLAGTIELDSRGVGEHLQTGHRVRLRSTPADPLDITLTVDDSSVALLSSQSTSVGSGSLVLESVTTDDQQDFYIQGLSEGVTTLTAFAPGFTPVSSTISVTPSGFYISSPNAIDTSTLSDPQSVRIEVGRLRPAASGIQRGQIRAGLSVTVPIELADPGVGTLLDTPLIFEGGDSSFPAVRFSPQSPGSTAIDISQPAGFTAPGNERVSIPVEVRTPGILGFDDIFVGEDLQEDRRVRLSVSPPAPVDVVLSIANPEVALVSPNRDEVGLQTITLTDVDQTWGGPTVWIQGVSRGATVLTASAPGYEPIETTLTVTESGFFIDQDSPTVTTTYSSPTWLGVQSARLDALGRFADAQGLRAGQVAEITVSSSDPGVGEITESPLVFTSASGVEENTTLVPGAIGRTTVSIGQPPGFNKPFDRNEVVEFDVVAPRLELEDFVIGESLQANHRFRLQERPPEPVDVEVVVADPSIALVSGASSEAGSASIILEDVIGFTGGGLYIHGVEEGVTSVSISAPGYAPAEAVIEVVESGFAIVWPGSIETTPVSVPTPIAIRVSQSSPPNHHWMDTRIRAGLSVAVPVAVEDPTVGQMSSASVIFEGDAGPDRSVDFLPNTLGMTRISVMQPPGFEELPDRTHSIPVTVETPEIFVSSLSAGINLQSLETVRLSDTPETPVDVRISVADTAVAILSKSPGAVGGAWQVFEDVAATNLLYFYLQGLQRGSTTLTVTAPGFETIEVPVSVTNAGFFIDWPNAVSTSVGDLPTTLTVRSAQLSDTGLAMAEQGLRAAMIVTVPVSTDDPQIGTITTSPLIFAGGQESEVLSTGFRPEAVGNTTIRLTQPPGFIDPNDLEVAIPAEVRE